MMSHTAKKLPTTNPAVNPVTLKVEDLGQEVVDVAVLPLPVIDVLIVVDVYCEVDDPVLHSH